MQNNKSAFPNFWGRSIVIGLVVTLLGLIGWIFAVAFELSNPWLAFLSTAASALVTIGCASIIYESWQKEVFLKEIRTSIGLNEEIVTSGFQSLGEPSVHRLQGFLDSSNRLDLAPLNPENWYANFLSSVFETANKRSLEIKLYLPSHESDRCVQSFVSETDQEDKVRSSLAQLPQKIARQWKDEITSAESSLEILTYETPLTTGFYRLSKINIIEISAYQSNIRGLKPRLWNCVDSTSSNGVWIEEQIRRIHNDSGTVEKPTPLHAESVTDTEMTK